MFCAVPEVISKMNFTFLNIIDKSNTALLFLVVSTVLHPLWCWLFVTYLSLDTLGCGISMIISATIGATLSQLYIHYANPLPEAYFPMNSDCFEGWAEYTSVAISSMFIVVSEFWAYEVFAIVSLVISKLDYAVYVLNYNIFSLLFTISLGFGLATTILAGKYITEVGAKETKRMVIILFAYGSIVSFLASLTLLIVGKNVF